MADKPSSRTMSKNASGMLGPVFFMAAVLGILAAAIAVGCGSLGSNTVPVAVTVKMAIDPE